MRCWRGVELKAIDYDDQHEVNAENGLDNERHTLLSPMTDKRREFRVSLASDRRKSNVGRQKLFASCSR